MPQDQNREDEDPSRKTTQGPEGDYLLNNWLYQVENAAPEIPIIPDVSPNPTSQAESSDAALKQAARRFDKTEFDRHFRFGKLNDEQISNPPSHLSFDLEEGGTPGGAAPSVWRTTEAKEKTEWAPEDTDLEPPSITQLSVAQEVSLKSDYRCLFTYNNSREEAERAGRAEDFDAETEKKTKNRHVLISELEGALMLTQDYASLLSMGLPEMIPQWSSEAKEFEDEGKSLLARGDGTDRLW